MIETRLPIQIPPGLVKNGSLESRSGRWADGQFIRFLTETGAPVPIGAFEEVVLDTAPPIGGVGLAAYLWFVSNGTDVADRAVVVGKQTKVYVFDDLLNPIDITPSSPPSDPGTSNGSWSFANLNDILLASRASGPRDTLTSNLFSWDPDTVSTVLATVTNSPANVRGVVVTPESFVMVLRTERTITWASQGTLTTWTAAEGNSAGEIEVPTNGALVRLIVLGSETLALGDQDAWVLDYVDEPLYYGSRKIGDHCGLLAPNAVVRDGNVAYWMGPRGFFKYDGYVRPLPCPISDDIFTNMNFEADGRPFAINVSTHNEIWWYFPSTGGTVLDRCVRYNTVNETWVLDELGSDTRSCGIDAIWPAGLGAGHVTAAPLLFDASANEVYVHEAPGLIPGAFIESGPIKLDAGDHLMRVQKVYPDGAQTGDTITLFHSVNEPGGSEDSAGGGGANPSFDIRITARYVRYKMAFANATSTVGIPKLGVIESSRR